MWSKDIEGLHTFSDIEIREQRLPIIQSLETALINAKPKNTVSMHELSSTSSRSGLKSS